MKKLFLWNAFLFLFAFGAQAQPFSQSFTNTSGYSCDHYSIEMYNIAGRSGYAIAGSFYDGSNWIMHVFTLDALGNIIWENYVNLGATEARALDVTFGPDFSVAITGYVDGGSGEQLYAAWYDNVGNLINDFWYAGATNSTGNNIIYSATNDQFIIGGFEYNGPVPPTGNALMIALDGGFGFQWDNTFSSSCDDFGMAVINEIVEINSHYFITGNVSDAASPFPLGQSQVLVAMVENSTGALLTNASFAATGAAGQQAMGVSAHYNPAEEELVLLYNVSISPTVDENRPYMNIYNVSGVDLNYLNTYRVDDLFPANPSGFVTNPNFTGLKLLRNRANDTYIIFGMIEAYGGSDRVISVWQEVDLNTGTVVGPARTWTPSDIATGYPAQGGLYSLFDPAILNTRVYSPETTVRSIDNQHFVSILPTPGGSPITYDVISSTLNTVDASSPCIEDFEIELVPHEIFPICLEDDAPVATFSAPLYVETPYASTVVPGCFISMAPSVGLEQNEAVAGNELTVVTNPANDVLQFSIAETGTYQVMIMNMEGQVLISDQLQNSSGQQAININQLASGMYVLVAIDANGQHIKERFVKK